MGSVSNRIVGNEGRVLLELCSRNKKMQENWALSQNITFSCPKAREQDKKGTIPRLSQGFAGALSSKT